MSVWRIILSRVNGDSFEVVFEAEGPDDLGVRSGLQLRERIRQVLDRNAKVETPLEVIAVVKGDEFVADSDEIVLDSEAHLQFVKQHFPQLDFKWMIFHMWENFLAGDEFACPTSCEDYVIFYRRPSSHIASGYRERGGDPTLYDVNFEQLCVEDCLNRLQHVCEEAEPFEAELYDDQRLPPCRASVIPHLVQSEERQKLADLEKIMVYTEAEWRIAIYQEIQVKGRPWQELFGRYPYEDVIEAFLSAMSWGAMREGRPSSVVELKGDETCRLCLILEKWIQRGPFPINTPYESCHPTLPQKLADVKSIIHEA